MFTVLHYHASQVNTLESRLEPLCPPYRLTLEEAEHINQFTPCFALAVSNPIVFSPEQYLLFFTSKYLQNI